MKNTLNTLKDLKILVTGSSRGIGRETSLQLARYGATVYALSRTTSALRELSHEAQELDGSIIPVTCDLTIPGEVYKARDQIEHIDVLIHNAGYFKPALLSDTALSEWNQHIQVNTTAALLLLQQFWPDLIASAHAAVVMVSSLAGVCGPDKFATAGAYTASKMAVTGLAEVAAAEGKEHQIRVNVVSPGSVETDMLKTAFPDMQADFTAEDVARQILFYASPASSPVSGVNAVMKK